MRVVVGVGGWGGGEEGVRRAASVAEPLTSHQGSGSLKRQALLSSGLKGRSVSTGAGAPHGGLTEVARACSKCIRRHAQGARCRSVQGADPQGC